VRVSAKVDYAVRAMAVTLADLAAGKLPAEIRVLTADEYAWHAR